MDTEMNNPSHHHIDQALLIRFLSGEANAQEQHAVAQWMAQDEQNHRYFQELSVLWNASAAAGSFDAIYLSEDWKKVQDKIVQAPSKAGVRQPVQRSLVYRFARMAAVIIFCAGFYFLVQRSFKPWMAGEVVASALQPLTVTLPDGSAVYLNSGSKLIYPEKFDAQSRTVTLQGEAFFEVSKDLQKPFLIKTGNAITEVVGTSFNVNSNAHKVVVTVVTGKVLLYEQRSEAVALTVGEQGIYSGKGLEKKVNDDPNFLSWKTGVLTFQNTPLSKVASDLVRHYGVHIQITPGALEGCRLTSVYRNQSLEEIIHELSVVFSLQVERRGDAVIIQGKGC
jgi:transmembrane sensor